MKVSLRGNDSKKKWKRKRTIISWREAKRNSLKWKLNFTYWKSELIGKLRRIRNLVSRSKQSTYKYLKPWFFRVLRRWRYWWEFKIWWDNDWIIPWSLTTTRVIWRFLWRRSKVMYSFNLNQLRHSWWEFKMWFYCW